jgi:hypothetical protein
MKRASNGLLNKGLLTPTLSSFEEEREKSKCAIIVGRGDGEKRAG